MNKDDVLSGERTQLLATLTEMGEVLRTIERLALLRGAHHDWESVMQQLTEVRVRVQHRPLGEDFKHAMEFLCLVYDAFVERTLPNPEVH